MSVKVIGDAWAAYVACGTCGTRSHVYGIASQAAEAGRTHTVQHALIAEHRAAIAQNNEAVALMDEYDTSVDLPDAEFALVHGLRLEAL